MSFKVVHYINQFFANIGGEEMAHVAPELRDGIVGPGLAFNTAWKGEAEIVNTIVCGDSYFAEHEKEAKEQILAWVKEIKPDFFIAGPAFNAGRYGYACANVAIAVQELGIPVLTGMYTENPGADYKDKVMIVSTKDSAAGMRQAAPTMAKLALKIMKGEKIGASVEEGYMNMGIRVNMFEKERGAKRAVDMLIKKLNGKPYVTEYPMPSFDRVTPGKAIKDLSKATIALCTSGGIVPKGNPDHIESSSASHYGEYSIAGVDDLTSDKGKQPTADMIPSTPTRIPTASCLSTLCASSKRKALSASCMISSIQQLVTAQPLLPPRSSLLSMHRSWWLPVLTASS